MGACLSRPQVQSKDEKPPARLHPTDTAASCAVSANVHFSSNPDSASDAFAVIVWSSNSSENSDHAGFGSSVPDSTDKCTELKTEQVGELKTLFLDPQSEVCTKLGITTPEQFTRILASLVLHDNQLVHQLTELMGYGPQPESFKEEQRSKQKPKQVVALIETSGLALTFSRCTWKAERAIGVDQLPAFFRVCAEPGVGGQPGTGQPGEVQAPSTQQQQGPALQQLCSTQQQERQHDQKPQQQQQEEKEEEQEETEQQVPKPQRRLPPAKLAAAQPPAAPSALSQQQQVQLQRLSVLSDAVQANLTLCTLNGKVLWQNARSREWAGTLTPSSHSSGAPANGGGAPPAADTAPSFLSQLFQLQPELLDDMLECVMGEDVAAPWTRVVQVPISLQTAPAAASAPGMPIPEAAATGGITGGAAAPEPGAASPPLAPEQQSAGEEGDGEGERTTAAARLSSSAQRRVKGVQRRSSCSWLQQSLSGNTTMHHASSFAAFPLESVLEGSSASCGDMQRLAPAPEAAESPAESPAAAGTAAAASSGDTGGVPGGIAAALDAARHAAPAAGGMRPSANSNRHRLMHLLEAANPSASGARNSSEPNLDTHGHGLMLSTGDNDIATAAAATSRGAAARSASLSGTARGPGSGASVNTSGVSPLARCASANAAAAAVAPSRLEPAASLQQHEAAACLQQQQQQPEEEEGEGDAYSAPELCWHEVCCTCVLDPASGQQAVLVMQTDVTERSELERRLMRLSESQLYLLENMFPRHVLEKIARLAVANQQTAGGDPAAAGRESRGSAGADEDAPADVLHQLGNMAANHECVTIMFADIVGFTSMSKEVLPSQVMMFLNDLFSRLDDLVPTCRVYKVETAGDCYIVAGGLFHEDEEGFRTIASDDRQVHHMLAARRVLNFACCMLAAARQVNMPNNGQPVQMRVGIHSGPVVSGLIGTQMPKYALFGDTMNTASRMESTSKPGRVQVSSSTYTLLQDSAERWDPTGGVEVKGKGVMETYLLRPQFAQGVPTAWEVAQESTASTLVGGPTEGRGTTATDAGCGGAGGGGASMAGRDSMRRPSVIELDVLLNSHTDACSVDLHHIRELDGLGEDGLHAEASPRGALHPHPHHPLHLHLHHPAAPHGPHSLHPYDSGDFRSQTGISSLLLADLPPPSGSIVGDVPRDLCASPAGAAPSPLAAAVVAASAAADRERNSGSSIASAHSGYNLPLGSAGGSYSHGGYGASRNAARRQKSRLHLMQEAAPASEAQAGASGGGAISPQGPALQRQKSLNLTARNLAVHGGGRSGGMIKLQSAGGSAGGGYGAASPGFTSPQTSRRGSQVAVFGEGDGERSSAPRTLRWLQQQQLVAGGFGGAADRESLSAASSQRFDAAMRTWGGGGLQQQQQQQPGAGASAQALQKGHKGMDALLALVSAFSSTAGGPVPASVAGSGRPGVGGQQPRGARVGPRSMAVLPVTGYKPL